jgi:hypothetical protein
MSTSPQVLLARLKAWRDRRKAEYAKKKIEGKPSPLRPGSPESSQSHTGGADELRFGGG